MIELKNLGEVCLTDRELYALGSAFAWCQARSRWARSPGSAPPLELKRASIRFRQARDELGKEKAAALEKKVSELCRLIARGLTDRELKQGMRRQRKNRKRREHGPTVFKS